MIESLLDCPCGWNSCDSAPIELGKVPALLSLTSSSRSCTNSCVFVDIENTSNAKCPYYLTKTVEVNGLVTKSSIKNIGCSDCQIDVNCSGGRTISSSSQTSGTAEEGNTVNKRFYSINISSDITSSSSYTKDSNENCVETFSTTASCGGYEIFYESYDDGNTSCLWQQTRNWINLSPSSCGFDATDYEITGDAPFCGNDRYNFLKGEANAKTTTKTTTSPEPYQKTTYSNEVDFNPCKFCGDDYDFPPPFEIDPNYILQGGQGYGNPFNIKTIFLKSIQDSKIYVVPTLIPATCFIRVWIRSKTIYFTDDGCGNLSNSDPEYENIGSIGIALSGQDGWCINDIEKSLFDPANSVVTEENIVEFGEFSCSENSAKEFAIYKWSFVDGYEPDEPSAGFPWEENTNIIKNGNGYGGITIEPEPPTQE